MLLVLLSFACSPPVKAPDDLEALTTFIYEHVMNPDPRYIEAGATNLKRWLELHEQEAKEGYEVNNLTEESVLNLGLDIPDLFDEQVGLAAAYDMSASVDQVAEVLLTVDCDETNPTGCADVTTINETDPDLFWNVQLKYTVLPPR